MPTNTSHEEVALQLERQMYIISCASGIDMKLLISLEAIQKEFWLCDDKIRHPQHYGRSSCSSTTDEEAKRDKLKKELSQVEMKVFQESQWGKAMIDEWHTTKWTDIERLSKTVKCLREDEARREHRMGEWVENYQNRVEAESGRMIWLIVLWIILWIIWEVVRQLREQSSQLEASLPLL